MTPKAPQNSKGTKNLDFIETIKADKKNKSLTDTQINDIVNCYLAFIQLKEDIVKNCKVNKIKTSLEGNDHDGEGYVITKNGNALKLVSTEDFTKHNIEHMNKKKIGESVEGDVLKIWSSSKDSNLNISLRKKFSLVYQVVQIMDLQHTVFLNHHLLMVLILVIQLKFVLNYMVKTYLNLKFQRIKFYF